MLGGAVEAECFVVVHSGPGEVPMNAACSPWCGVQPSAHRAPLLPAQRQKPRCELVRNVTIEAYEIDDPLAKQAESSNESSGSSPSCSACSINAFT